MDKNYWGSRKILIVGASSDLASEALPALIERGCKVGMHYSSNRGVLVKYENENNAILIQNTINSEADCKSIVEEYVSWADGIDGIVIFLGNISNTCHWSEIGTQQLENDYLYNAVYPFLLAKHACSHMKNNTGGYCLSARLR